MILICTLMVVTPLHGIYEESSLDDTKERMQSASTASGWVLDQTMTISNGAWLEDTVIVDNYLYLLLSHNGNGSIGQNSWQTNQSGIRLVKMTTLGSIDSAVELGDASDGELHPQSNGVIARLSTGKTLHEFLEIDTSLSIGDRISISGTNSSGGDAHLTLHASSGAGTSLIAMFSCAIPATGTASVLSQTCTDSNNNRRYITMKWDASTNTTSTFSTSSWLRETATELEYYLSLIHIDAADE